MFYENDVPVPAAIVRDRFYGARTTPGYLAPMPNSFGTRRWAGTRCRAS